MEHAETKHLERADPLGLSGEAQHCRMAGLTLLPTKEYRWPKPPSEP